MSKTIAVSLSLISFWLNANVGNFGPPSGGRGIGILYVFGLGGIFASEFLSSLAEFGTVTGKKEHIHPFVFQILGYVMIIASFVPLIVRM